MSFTVAVNSSGVQGFPLPEGLGAAPPTYLPQQGHSVPCTSAGIIKFAPNELHTAPGAIQLSAARTGGAKNVYNLLRDGLDVFVKRKQVGTGYIQ